MMEYYANPSVKLSRIFPVFFGKRTDVFGQIGDLFKDPVYTSLPSVRPEASLQLAARLLRENGLEPRPEMFRLTAKDIVERMKKYLCVFAWTLPRPDLVTEECVAQMLRVVEAALAEGGAAPAPSDHSIAQTTPTGGSGEAPGGLKFMDCISLIRENLCIDARAPPAVVQEALSMLADPALTQRCAGRPLAEQAEAIVLTLGLGLVGHSG